ncbi:PilW family protein [Gallaecimonas mangrovi]|uniref:PilW family protein n=1 Tax=Gallaecimonas mangrovi TaxID=2291597 RepID=UPI000E20B7A0|nr:type II secretion system protein [Gallaecimonas mangrovi]
MKARGFTLVELVAVIVVMGIVALGSYGYLRFGSQLYGDTVARAHTLSQGRFAVERLTRELRNAVPNSVRVSSDGSCIEFVPIAAAVRYFDAPVAPDSGNTIKVVWVDPAGTTPSSGDAIDWNSDFFGTSLWAMLNPTQSSQIYSPDDSDRRVMALASSAYVDDGYYLLTLASTTSFAKDSPSMRLYLGGQPVSFCQVGANLYRYENYGFIASQPLPSTGLTNGQLMAQQLASSSYPLFRYDSAVLTRNAVVHILLKFQSVGEDDLFFNLEVHQPNVP